MTMVKSPQSFQEVQQIQHLIFGPLKREVKETISHRQQVSGHNMGSLIWYSTPEDLVLSNPFAYGSKKQLQCAIVEFMKSFYDLLHDYETHFQYQFNIFLTPEYSLQTGELRNYYFQSFVLNDEEAGDMFQRFSKTKYYVNRNKFMQDIEKYLFSQFSKSRVLPLVFYAELYKKKYPGGSGGRRDDFEGDYGRFQAA